MRKFLFIIPSLRKGGAERVVSLLSQELVKRGFKVKIILFTNKVEYTYGGELIILNSPPSSNFLFKIFRLIQRIFKLKKVFKEEKADCIISFMESCNFPAILTGEKIIVSIRNNPEKKHNWYQKFLIKFLYKKKNVKKVVCVSKEIEQILIKKFHIKNTTTIYNPVVFQKSYKVKQDLSRYKPFLLAVGRLHYQKNFDMLIKAFNRTQTKNKANLLIIGEGEERKNLEILIKNLKLEKKVYLLGKKNNIEDYYRQAELFILSSRFEGFPNVLVEALSHGCACISTNCPTGPSELIKNGLNGILVENENEQELAQAIDKVFFNEELKSKLRQNAKISLKHLELGKIVDKWLEICKEE